MLISFTKGLQHFMSQLKMCGYQKIGRPGISWLSFVAPYSRTVLADHAWPTMPLHYSKRLNFGCPFDKLAGWALPISRLFVFRLNLQHYNSVFLSLALQGLAYEPCARHALAHKDVGLSLGAKHCYLWFVPIRDGVDILALPIAWSERVTTTWGHLDQCHLLLT